LGIVRSNPSGALGHVGEPRKTSRLAGDRSASGQPDAWFLCVPAGAERSSIAAARPAAGESRQTTRVKFSHRLLKIAAFLHMNRAYH
jgi:hypothetical protein